MKKKNILLMFVIILTVGVFLTACGGEATEPGGSGEVFNLKMGHVGPADATHPWEKYAQEFAKQIEEKTNGQIKVTTYPASQLGADREMTEALQQNTMEIGLISTIAMGNFVPEMQVWDLPYIFPNDNAKVDEILEGPVGEKLATAAAEKGLIVLAYWENDWRNMSNSKHPIKAPSDLNGLKMRVVENQPSIDWFQRLGAIPTPMAFSEVYTSLQQGTIDGQDNGPVLTYGSRFFEVQPYYTVTNHIYCPLAFVVSAKTWEKLPEDVQTTMKELAVELGRQQRNYNREMGQKYLDDMEEAGVEVIRELSPDNLKAFQDSAQPTYEAMTSAIGADLIDEMLQYGK